MTYEYEYRIVNLIS